MKGEVGRMKKRDYLYNLCITILILGAVFALKNLFPFGSETIIWEDMGGQITPMYYQFYDAVRNGSSLFISYSAGNGVNFLGNMGYYIISPFTLLVLAFPRDMIPQAVNVIMILKIAACSFTFLYAIKKISPKLGNGWAILFSNMYAFSSYIMCLYLIPNFIDTVYLFPLLVLGMMYLLQGKPKLYLGILTASLIMNFYLSLIVLIFVVLAFNVYFLIYKPENKKKCITDLGLSTVLALLISCVILVPTLMQIKDSARFGFSFDKFMNSRFGPFTDKAAYLLSCGFDAAMLILLIKRDRKDKFTKFLTILLVLMLIPVLIEPINKMWHFGSYVSFPYRYGFITIFLFLCSSAYYVSQLPRETSTATNKVISILISMVTCGAMAFLAKKFYPDIQKCVTLLTYSYDKKIFVIVLGITLLTFIATLLLFTINKKDSRFVFKCIAVIAVVFTLINCSFNFKSDTLTADFNSYYKDMNALYQAKPADNYSAKMVNYGFTDNAPWVTGVPSSDSFTSLTNGSSFETMQRLGYDSYWMNTMSRGANLFTDILLGNKYLLSGEEVNDTNYTYQSSYNNLKLYQLNYPVEKGYLFQNAVSIKDAKNSFEASNILSQELMQKDIFTITTDFDTHNLTYSDGKITVNGDDAYFEKTVQVSDQGIVYFEIYNAFDNATKTLIYKNFDVYVNDKLVEENYPNKTALDTINLGEFKDQSVKVKVVVKKDCTINDISLGVMHVNMLDYFKQNDTPVNVNYDRSTVNVTYTSAKDGILYLPINDLKGFTATVNGQSTPIVKVMDNYIGVAVTKGENTIQLKYVPDGALLGLGLTGIGIVLLVLYNMWLKKDPKHPVLDTVAYGVYTVVWYGLVAAFYVIPFALFILSFLHVKL